MKTSNKIGISLIVSKVADVLLSAKTTLPTLLSVAGAPAWMTQLLVPIREAGALMPQMLYAKLLENKSSRQFYWQIGMLLQLVFSIVMVFLIPTLEGFLAGALLLISLAVFSLARALTSLLMKDIQGVHIQEGNRGRLFGWASTLSSAISAFIAGLSLYGSLTNSMDKIYIVGGLAIVCQGIAIAVLLGIKTCVDTEHKNAGFVFTKTMNKFVIVRSLLAHSALLAPVYVLAYDGDLVGILGYLIVAQSLASFVSSYIWGSLSDDSARLSMRLGATVCLLANATLFVIMMQYTELLKSMVWVVGLYFVLSIGHNGIRTGRKIYGVDIAEGQDRTVFVASTNTLVGIALLVFGGIYSFTSSSNMTLTLVIMTAALFVGFLGSFFLSNEKSE